MDKFAPLRILANGWRSVREAGTKRLLFTGVLLVLALLLARFSWELPFTQRAELALYDARAYMLAEEIEGDDRITMVVYTDQTLFDYGKRSPLPRDLLANALRTLDGMGPKAIGIDILFDQYQEEDDALIAALREMQTPVAIAYAEIDTNAGDIEYFQQEYLVEFLNQLDGSNARPASIRLNESHGVTRIWPQIFDHLPPLLGRAMLEDAGEPNRMLPGYEGGVRYRHAPEAEIDPETGAAMDRTSLFVELDISLFADPAVMAIPEVSEEIRSVVEGRYILIGGDLTDFDQVETTFTSIDGETRPGLEVHAELLGQMLDGAALRPVSQWYLWALALLVVIAAALTALLELRNLRFVPLLVIQLLIFLGLPFFLHARGVDTYAFPAVGPALAWVVAFTAVTSAARASGAVQRQFAQGALGKYLPQSIADEIIEKPELLSLGGEKRAIYVLFSDLEGFTKMSHAIQPEMVAKLLNRYLEMLSDVVLEHGGILDKFIGDAVVAFWGAPIARPDDADRAARCGYAIWQAGEAFRAEVAAMDPDLPKIGKTRVGLHFGEAVVGNFGGENRIQYTALGDSMNTAARMESGNKAFGSSIMATGDFANRTQLDWWRRMGRVVLSGRSSPVDLYEPAPDFPEEDRLALNAAVAQLDGDPSAGIAAIRAVAGKYPDDAALAALVERSQHLNADGAHVLAGK